ncbi:MAG: Phenylacetaldehyde dehydrogenase [Bradyrhizobium sp.]|nr:Phenylacetaldehyde dehydrogenase [Bradyrhizobium sp.]
MAYNGPFELDPGTTAFLERDPFLFVEGRAVESESKATLEVFDPSRAQVIALIPDATTGDVDRAVRSAHTAFEDGRWRHMRPADRERILMRFADLLAERGEVLAQLETLEQGKSISLSRMISLGSAAENVRYVAGLTTKVSGRTFDTSLPGGPNRWTTYTRREPIGVVAGIAPWNFPVTVGLWKVMPALAAGCSVVLKPSEFTPLTALWLAELAIEAGVPAGVFNVVTGSGAVAGAALTGHPLVSKITFTGSTATGKAIGRSAMDDLKRVTLELGGKNPAIILKDADLSAVVPGLMLGGFLNGGQVCAAASRVYVEAPLYDDLVSALADTIRNMRVGPGMDPTAQVNPLTSSAHQAKVKSLIEDARSKGGEFVNGAAVPDEGYYVSPTLLLNPDDSMQIARTEAFGPVLGLVKVADADEAVARANDSEFGLGASLWTRDLSAAMNLTQRIQAGTVWVNAHVVIDPNMPFGGYKQSGVGREFGPEWLDPYTEVKSICIRH